MRHRLDSRGFTIIETLIFLSISGFVFFAAIGGYTQRQKQVEFTQGVREFQARLQDLVNDVGSGYYPDLTAKCRAVDDTSNPRPYFDTTATSSNGCVWLGKAIQLGARSDCNRAALTDRCNRYISFPIVARKNYVDSSNNKFAPDNFAQAKPTALTTCLEGMYTPCETRPNAGTFGYLQGGIGVYKIFVRNADGSAGASTGAVAFMSALENRSSNFGRLDKASAVDLVYVPATDVRSAEVLVTNQIDNALTAAHINPINGITFCIKGANNQFSAITIGAGGRTADVSVQSIDQIDSGCAND